VGGFAGVLYGSSLVTRDLDLCLLLSPENIAKLRTALKDFNPKHRISPQKPSFLKYPEELESVNNLYLETDLGVVDIISHVTGVGDFKKVSKKSNLIELFGHTCKVISIEDLISAKKILGREKDIAMIKELRVIQAGLKKKK